MILADKIVLLRKKCGWSQEELAEKMNVSRQSVSKWESTNSIPDLNKIIMLANIFDVSTDSLLKDEMEVFEPLSDNVESGVHKISLEKALTYVDSKLEISALVTKGVILCLCSVVPLFFLLAMAETNRLNLSGTLASVLGIISLLVMVSVAIYFFIKTNQFQAEISQFENELFELEYGVHSVINEKLRNFRATYNFSLSIGIFFFIVSFVPLMVVSIFWQGAELTLLMLIVLLFIIALGIYIVSPVVAQYEAYNTILNESCNHTAKGKRVKRAEKLAAFYWPLLIAVYLGWSLWNMEWGVTWIVWPVGAVLFAALVGLTELLNKDEQ